MDRISKVWHSGLAMLLALCLLICACPVTAFAAENDVAKKEVMNYVSFGASNANGYGMSGYLPADITVENKDSANVYGYQRMPVGSYPYLIAEELNKALGGTESTYNGNLKETQPFTKVHVDQLAMSSMRMEELRFLLDESYSGDSYTDWRFYELGLDNKQSQNWFGKAEADLSTLRSVYRNAIEDADVITLDMGINNFGVYVSHQTGNPAYKETLEDIDPTLAAQYSAAKAQVKQLAAQYSPNAVAMLDQMDSMIDTLAYALAGFCTSFDIVIEKIHELNPDAKVVVVSIQNLLTGLSVKIDGFDEELPLGDIFGAVINAANLYTASGSPYSDNYLYADVRKGGRVNFFVDDLLAYNGDPNSLSQNMIDCYTVYDEDLNVFSNINALVDAYLAGEIKTALTPYISYLANIYGSSEEEKILMSFLADGSKGFEIAKPMLSTYGPEGEECLAKMESAYNMYANTKPQLMQQALFMSFDVLTELFQAGVKDHTINFSALASPDAGKIEDALLAEIANAISTAIAALAADPAYQFTLSEAYPDGFYETVAADVGVDASLVKSIACMAIRTGIGNSFFGHPTPLGHKQIKDAVWVAMEDSVTGKDVVKDEIKIALGELKGFLDKLDPETTAAILDKVNLDKAITSHLKLDEKSVYVALGDGSAEKKGYVELLGDHLVAEYGIKNVYNYAATGNTVGAELEKAATRKGIADASLITIGFSNVTMLHNAIRNAGKAEYNWLEMVGEDMLPIVQEALGSVSATIADMGLNDNWTKRLNSVVEGFAYSAVEYAIKLPELIDEIRTVNDDAVIAVVGQYNPMAGVVMDVGGATLDMSAYIDGLVDAVTVHGIGYAAVSGEFIFVEAPAVEISSTDKIWTEEDLVFGMLLNGFKDLYPSANGDQYIANRILGALKINEYTPTNPFVDVAEGAYYYDAVLWAVEKGITTGTGDGTTFEPNGGCTRGQIATFLWRAAGSPAPASTKMPFKDVAANAYYATAVAWAAEQGITTGTKNGDTFEPNATCTRGQIVTMLARYLKGAPSGNNNPFTDVPGNAYYTDAVLWAVEKGITTGTGDGTTFEPNATCTRGQIVTFLFRALNK